MSKSKTHILLKVTISIIMMILMNASTWLLIKDTSPAAIQFASAIGVTLITLQTWYRYKWSKTKNKIENFMANMFLVE